MGPLGGERLELGTLPGQGLPAEVQVLEGGAGRSLSAVGSWWAASSVSHTPHSPGDTGPLPVLWALSESYLCSLRNQGLGAFCGMRQTFFFWQQRNTSCLLLSPFPWRPVSERAQPCRSRLPGRRAMVC